MTDKEKLEKLKKLADAMYYAVNYLTTDASRLHKAMDEYHKFIIDSMQEECNITGIKSKHATGKLKECIDLVKKDKFFSSNEGEYLEEETNYCAFSTSRYTDEDRKAICEGCEEKCEFNKKDEIKSVHAQHTTISSSLNDYLCKAYNALYKGNGGILSFARLQNMAIDITEWQKEQIIKRLCNHANIDQMVEKFEDKYKPRKVFDTEYYKRGIFDTIKAIKED